MGIINVVQTIKEVHKYEVILVKIGKFYQVYGKDAYIISYLFGYKLKKVENVMMCGFPLSSIHKVMAKLETNKINYLIVDRRNTYEVEEISDNKNLNQYIKYFKKAKKYVNYKIRIEYIYHFMLENMEKEYMKDFINKIEEMIDERRKVSSN